MIDTNFLQCSPLIFFQNFETYAFYIKNKFFWAKVFSDLKSVGWHKLTVEYLKLSTNTWRF